MSFDPAGFVSLAKRLANRDGSQEARRTVVGRCYYGVYASLRAAVAGAKGISEQRLFGESGRHRDLYVALTRGGGELAPLAGAVGSLLQLRVRADYVYASTGNISDAEAQSALEDAEDALAHLSSLKPSRLAALSIVER